VEPISGSGGDGEAALHFAVSDTGIGLPEELRDAVFEGFQQGDPSTTRRYGGTGLGLSISKELVEMMGGQMRVESPSHVVRSSLGGPGSTFHFTAHLKRAPAHWRPRRRPVGVRGRRALIVDDNATNRRILREMLASWGMLPTEAASADEATRLVKEALHEGRPYDILLLDFQMPGKNGFQVMEELTDAEALAESVVMMLTSAERSNHRARCRQLGIKRCLTKPVSPSELLDNITDVLHPTGPEPDVPGQVDAPRRPPVRLDLSVLLAEDNEINRKVAQHMLERVGCRITAVSDGEEALQAVQQGDFDVALMDVQLPVVDGLEVTRRLRRQEEGEQHLPIVAMTAHAMKGDREKCIEAGMDDYLSKPISSERLYDVVSRCTGSRLAVTEAGAAGPAADASAAPFDSRELLGRVAGDQDLARELLEIFARESPAKLASIRSALAAGNFAQIRALAHEMKGTAANLAAKGVLSASLLLEQRAEEEDAAGAKRALADLEATLQGLNRMIPSLAACWRQRSRSGATRCSACGTESRPKRPSAGGRRAWPSSTGCCPS
jgi:CheY-like chemotaxis protein